jgi:HPt (histidine-containing phosphotransfer) domain-containing protein
MRSAAASGDLPAVSRVAHKLKSSSRSVGALPFGDACADLENVGKLADASAVADRLANMDALWTRVRDALDATLAVPPLVP